METLQEAQLSYNKAAALASSQAENINTAVHNYALTQWAQDTSAYVLPTTGKTKDGVTTVRSAEGTTGAKSGYDGNVYRFGYEDMLTLMETAKKQNIQGGQWYVLPTVEMWSDILRIEELVSYEKTGNETMLKSGVIGRWGDFMFLNPRQNDRWNANVLYDITTPTAPSVVAYGGALNANCVSGLIAWNSKYVERNPGTVKFFSRKDDPVYMGDIVNWGVRFGASKRRSDGRGVIGFYEAKSTGGAGAE